MCLSALWVVVSQYLAMYRHETDVFNRRQLSAMQKQERWIFDNCLLTSSHIYSRRLQDYNYASSLIVQN